MLLAELVELLGLELLELGELLEVLRLVHERVLVSELDSLLWELVWLVQLRVLVWLVVSLLWELLELLLVLWLLVELDRLVHDRLLVRLELVSLELLVLCELWLLVTLEELLLVTLWLELLSSTGIEMATSIVGRGRGARCGWSGLGRAVSKKSWPMPLSYPAYVSTSWTSYRRLSSSSIVKSVSVPASVWRVTRSRGCSVMSQIVIWRLSYVTPGLKKSVIS